MAGWCSHANPCLPVSGWLLTCISSLLALFSVSEGCPAPMSLSKQSTGLWVDRAMEEWQQEVLRGWDSRDSLREVQSLTEATDSWHASCGFTGRYDCVYFTANQKRKNKIRYSSCSNRSYTQHFCECLCVGVYVCLQLALCSGRSLKVCRVMIL